MTIERTFYYIENESKRKFLGLFLRSSFEFFLAPLVFYERYRFSLHSWPRAVVHVDGDAFFTSCEEVIHPELRGKPLITGGERGIVACANYPAKKLGIQRGVPLHEARALCPELIILPSDYETYSLFSRRLFNIMRQFTPQVEEYSIDEAFADLTGMRRALRSSYDNIALKMKETICGDLGLNVSVGLSTTKVLAKVASKYRKPDGLTIISGRDIPDYLRDLPVEKIWGIGRATTEYLHKMGIRTALQYACLPENVIKKRFTKPGEEIWRELRGESVYPVSPGEKSTYASICKSKTFTPSTNDRDYLFAQLLRNFESACMKARRYFLAPKKIIIFLKKNDFNSVGAEAKLIGLPSTRSKWRSFFASSSIPSTTIGIFIDPRGPFSWSWRPTGTSSTPFSRNR